MTNQNTGRRHPLEYVPILAELTGLVVIKNGGSF